MAQKVAAATGAWSAAATWNSVTNTPTLHASTNITISTSNLFTATFTAPNLVNACTGVLLYIVAVGTGGTVTATLQESTVDTAAAVSIAVTSLVAGTWVYFRFATPYVFAAAGAGAYRFRIVNAAAAGVTTAAADSGAANIAYLATDDRTGVPASTDDVWISGQNQVTPITVTMDGTQTIGSGTYTGLVTTPNSSRQLGYAISLGNSGKLLWDTVADGTLTCKGSVAISSGGEFSIGSVATPMPVARIGKFRFDWGAATTGQFGFLINGGARSILQGVSKTYYKTKYASGVGTAASPLITADPVDWSVGDEILVASTGTTSTAYQETETKFIITKNSTTSYVLSNTSGGAEAAFTYTHTTDAWIVNLQRNVIIDSTDTAKGHGLYNKSVIAGDVDFDWARIETLSGGTTQIWHLSNQVETVPQIDYSVFYRSTSTRTPIIITTQAVLSFTGLIFTSMNPLAPLSADGCIRFEGANNKTLTDCFFIKNTGNGLGLLTAFNVTFARAALISNNTGGTANAGGVILVSSGPTFQDSEVSANRGRGIMLSNSGGTQFLNSHIGDRGNNIIDIDNVSGSLNTALFNICYFGSTTFVSNYLNMALGSELRFHKANGTENNHFWYLATGIARNSGAGLVDTTTKTAGNFAVRIAPENATTGFVWESLIGISANSAASVFGFIQKNTAFGTDVCTVELFLPGSTVADASQTMGNTTGTWLVFSMAAAYTGSVAAFARVRITAKTVTAAAYVYVADLYNGTNVLTSFKAWNDGKPSPVFTDLLGDPASVWAILESTQTTVGTMGYEISTDLATLRADVDDLQTRVPATLDGGNMRSSVKAMDNDIITAAVLAASAITEIQTGLAVPGSAMTLTAGERDAVAAAYLDLADAIETGLTPRQAMRLFASALAGVLSGAATNTVTIRNAVANSKARITATVDSDGNRTAVVTDVS